MELPHLSLVEIGSINPNSIVGFEFILSDQLLESCSLCPKVSIVPIHLCKLCQIIKYKNTYHEY